ncbi:MAG TPA: condensation domain-containing protein [Acidimicrobiales bacterium]|nr:condensation domain-containing protein [Acidimicrobiales bacterium]
MSEHAPVAVSQEPMIWHERFVPGSFNLPCLVRRYEGPLDVDAFEWALSETVRRHQPLRSTFSVVGGEPRQVVGDHPFHLAVVDLAGLPPEERDDRVADMVADATGRPFDLATGPLFEPRLVRLGPGDHLLVVRLHHTVFDDWSVDLFRRELSALYAARLEGAPSPLVEPEISFTDACRRQRARLAGPVGADERAWWRKELDGAPLSVQLPIGPGTPDGGEPVRLDLPAPLAAALRALGPTLRATPYMTVLSAFSVLLARRTGQDDLLIATVVAHRNRSDVEPLIGCFTKKVPLRLRVDGDPTFPELVARTRSSLLGSLSHQDLAFDAAVQEGVGRAAADHGVVPQVSVVFQAETPRRVKLSLPGLAVRPYEATRRERHFSSGAQPWGDGIYLGTFLILSLLESDEGTALIARGVFDRPTVRRLLEELESLLGEVVADPSRPVADLRGPVRPPAEDELVLRGFRLRRSPLEAALARCPGVAQVSLAVEADRLVATVVPAGRRAPTLAQLRSAVWAARPGAPWPAEANLVHGVVDPVASALAATWAEASGRPVGPRSVYWQDFSFLPALAQLRAQGMTISDQDVVRCRTPEMLAAAMALR